MSGQQYSPFTFFTFLSLLALIPPETLNKGLESLSFALQATSKSVENVKKGINTFHAGIQQLTQSTANEEFEQNNFGVNIQKKQGGGAAIMPVDAPGWEHAEDADQKDFQANDLKNDNNGNNSR